jgi:hypothetical protein
LPLSLKELYIYREQIHLFKIPFGCNLILLKC